MGNETSKGDDTEKHDLKLLEEKEKIFIKIRKHIMPLLKNKKSKRLTQIRTGILRHIEELKACNVTPLLEDSKSALLEEFSDMLAEVDEFLEISTCEETSNVSSISKSVEDLYKAQPEEDLYENITPIVNQVKRSLTLKENMQVRKKPLPIPRNPTSLVIQEIQNVYESMQQICDSNIVDLDHYKDIEKRVNHIKQIFTNKLQEVKKIIEHKKSNEEVTKQIIALSNKLNDIKMEVEQFSGSISDPLYKQYCEELKEIEKELNELNVEDVDVETERLKLLQTIDFTLEDIEIKASNIKIIEMLEEEIRVNLEKLPKYLQKSNKAQRKKLEEEIDFLIKKLHSLDLDDKLKDRYFECMKKLYGIRDDLLNVK